MGLTHIGSESSMFGQFGREYNEKRVKHVFITLFLRILCNLPVILNLTFKF